MCIVCVLICVHLYSILFTIWFSFDVILWNTNFSISLFFFLLSSFLLLLLISQCFVYGLFPLISQYPRLFYFIISLFFSLPSLFSSSSLPVFCSTFSSFPSFPLLQAILTHLLFNYLFLHFSSNPFPLPPFTFLFFFIRKKQEKKKKKIHLSV